jgi:hypothetical protein
LILNHFQLKHPQKFALYKLWFSNTFSDGWFVRRQYQFYFVGDLLKSQS